MTVSYRLKVGPERVRQQLLERIAGSVLGRFILDLKEVAERGRAVDVQVLHARLPFAAPLDGMSHRKRTKLGAAVAT